MALNVKQQIKKQGFETSQRKKKTERRYTELHYNEYTKAVGLAPRHLAFKPKLFILCSIAEAIVSVQWFFWLSSFCFFVLR